MIICANTLALDYSNSTLEDGTSKVEFLFVKKTGNNLHNSAFLLKAPIEAGFDYVT